MSADPTSQANYLHIVTENVSFDWTIDFAKKVVWGSATHTLKVLAGDVNQVMYVLFYITGMQLQFTIQLS